MKNRLVLSALSIAMLTAMGCSSMQTPAAAAPPAATPSFTSSAPEVHAALQFGGVLVSIYHPDTRTLYLWSGDPRPNVHRPMTCLKVQLSDNPSAAPVSGPCT